MNTHKLHDQVEVTVKRFVRMIIIIIIKITTIIIYFSTTKSLLIYGLVYDFINITYQSTFLVHENTN